jgi:hypothetical protein
VLTVIVTIMMITGGLYALLAVIVSIMTISGRCICSVLSDFDNNGEFICSVNSYCDNNDNNGEVYMRC